jgi:circadian clock protein KaiC
VVVLDPISSFGSAGSWLDTRGMLIRLIDFLKTKQITAVFTSLSEAGKNPDADSVGASSLVDAWVMVRNLEQNGEQTRGLTVLKARGANHSNQIRELLITDKGVDLRDIYLGPNGILAGSARDAQESDDRAVAKALGDDVKHKKELLARKRKAMRAQIAQIESEFASEAHAIGRSIVEESSRQKAASAGRAAQATRRSALRPIHDIAH